MWGHWQQPSVGQLLAVLRSSLYPKDNPAHFSPGIRRQPTLDTVVGIGVLAALPSLPILQNDKNPSSGTCKVFFPPRRKLSPVSTNTLLCWEVQIARSPRVSASTQYFMTVMQIWTELLATPQRKQADERFQVTTSLASESLRGPDGRTYPRGAESQTATCTKLRRNSLLRRHEHRAESNQKEDTG